MYDLSKLRDPESQPGGLQLNAINVYGVDL